ncbi:MAG: hypothetical protein GY777_08670 [Candidatus Brocadiaceae bacterium]|nr:hypothetical protein [Candidatus Brocadiaceae bacterium]
MNTPDDNLKYFDDDGNEINPDLISKPSLCVSCVKDEGPEEEMRVILTVWINRVKQVSSASLTSQGNRIDIRTSFSIGHGKA